MQTIDQFCAEHSFSRSYFYKLAQQGRAPRVVKIGRLSRISTSAAQEWAVRMETESAAGAA